MTRFVRFESAVPSRRGTHPGVFALANGLAGDGQLTDADLEWWRGANDRANNAYKDPSTVHVGCYDRSLNPGARAWFKESAEALVAFTREYLELLDRYQVRWVELRTKYPGRITYEDDVQIVAVPYEHLKDWPFHA